MLTICDAGGSTPAFYAASKNEAGVLAMLYDEYNVDRLVTNHQGRTAAHVAANNNACGALRVCLKGNSNLVELCDKNGLTVLGTAILHGSSDAARLLLHEFHVQPDRACLHLAIESNNSEIIRELITLDPLLKETAENDGSGWLHLAAGNGKLQALATLIECGANIRAANKYGDTAIHTAVQQGQLEVVKYLARTHKLYNCKDKTGDEPIHMAVIARQLPIIAYLVQEYPSVVHARDHTGAQPLHLAVGDDGETARKMRPKAIQSPQFREQVMKLLIDAKADLNAQDSHGGTPLHYAAQKGHKDAVKLLISRGVSVERTNVLGETPLEEAIMASQLEPVIILQSARHLNVNVLGQSGFNALQIAAFADRPDMIKLLVHDFGAQPSLTKLGMPTLHIGAFNGGPQTVKALIEFAYARVDETDSKFGETALHAAADGEHENAVATAVVLLDKGAHVDARDINHYTPLHRAASKGNLEVVKVLKAAGASINACARSGETPLHFAALYGNADIVHYLIQQGCDLEMFATVPSMGVQGTALDYVLRALRDLNKSTRAHDLNRYVPLGRYIERPHATLEQKVECVRLLCEAGACAGISKFDRRLMEVRGMAAILLIQCDETIKANLNKWVAQATSQNKALMEKLKNGCALCGENFVKDGILLPKPVSWAVELQCCKIIVHGQCAKKQTNGHCPCCSK